jgi:hypothetical protein
MTQMPLFKVTVYPDYFADVFIDTAEIKIIIRRRLESINF